MAVFALVNAYVSINSVDLSDHCRAVTINAQADQLDSTTFGDSWREYTGGLKSGTVAFEFLDDFATSSVDSTLFSILSTGTAVAVAVKPVNTTISTTNPEYQFNILPHEWNMGGSLGEMAAKSVTYNITGAITRDTTP